MHASIIINREPVSYAYHSLVYYIDIIPSDSCLHPRSLQKLIKAIFTKNQSPSRIALVPLCIHARGLTAHNGGIIFFQSLSLLCTVLRENDRNGVSVATVNIRII